VRILPSFDELVIEFLSQTKFAQHGPRWHTVANGDYAKASIRVAVPNSRVLQGRVIIAAHRLRIPPKYCLSVVFRAERVLALDVNPARHHRNLINSGIVNGTHWQRWPTMEAAPDNREMPFSGWLHDFLIQANVCCKFRVPSPPRGVQLEFTDGKDD
jgi:hypothetical protein